MAKFTKADLDFPFGYNVVKSPKKTGGKGKGKGKQGRANAWQAYVGGGKKR